MSKLLPITLAVTLAGSAAAIAQTSTTPSAPATPPAATAPAPSTTTPSTTTPSATAPSAATKDLVLTEAQAKSWINKPVYSSDGKKIGEVAAFTRDSSGKVSEMHADIGGFLGIGETRVRLMPAQFTLASDRVVLTVSSEGSKTLPKVVKK